MTTQQQQLLIELAGLKDQIEKGHYLNVHFRAFKLANDAWQEHIRQNAVAGARGGEVAGTSPAGAVLDDHRLHRAHRWGAGRSARCIYCGQDPLDWRTPDDCQRDDL